MNQRIRIVLGIIAVSCIIMCIGTYLYIGQYVQPSADDFGISYNTQQNLVAGEGYLSTAIKYTIQTYQEWQGSYSSVFILYETAIMVRYGIVGLKVFTMLIILSFYAALLYATRTVLRHCLSKNIGYYTLIIYAVLVFSISNMRIPKEVFYWYNVICIYTIPLSCCVLGSAFLIRYWDAQKNYYWLLACLCGLIAGGGSLQCTAIICYVYLILVLCAYWVRKEGRIKILIAFCCSLMAALINVVAPGNYARYDTVDGEGLHILDAIQYAVMNAASECGKIVITPYLMLALCMGLLVGYCMKNRTRIGIKHIGIVAIVSFLIMVISNFPVALGYSSAYMEERGYFVLDMLIVIAILIIMIMIGSYIAKIQIKYINVAILFILFTLISSVVLYRDSVPVAFCANNIQDGTLQKFDKMWDEAFEQIENSKEANVIIETKHFPNTGILKDPDFSTDATYWVNQGVARFYGKDSVALKYIE